MVMSALLEEDLLSVLLPDLEGEVIPGLLELLLFFVHFFLLIGSTQGKEIFLSNWTKIDEG